MKKFIKHATTILVTMAMAVGLCIGLAACGGGSSSTSDEQLIRSELDKAFSTLKNPTEDSIKELTGGDLSSLDELKQYGVDPIEMLQHFFGKFDYTIDNVKVDGDKAVATVTIKNIDFESVMNDTISNLTNDSEFMAQAQAVLTSSNGDETALYKLIFDKLFDALDNTDKLVSSTTELQLEKKNGEWDFTEEGKNALMSAMYGGLDFSSL